MLLQRRLLQYARGKIRGHSLDIAQGLAHSLATRKSTESTHTERFLSSLMAFISIFRRPMVVTAQLYLAVDAQKPGSQRPSQTMDGWRGCGVPGCNERRDSTTVIQRDRCVDRYDRGIMIRRSWDHNPAYIVSGMYIDAPGGLREVLNLNRRQPFDPVWKSFVP